MLSEMQSELQITPSSEWPLGLRAEWFEINLSRVDKE